MPNKNRRRRVFVVRPDALVLGADTRVRALLTALLGVDRLLVSLVSIVFPSCRTIFSFHFTGGKKCAVENSPGNAGD
jgi:hypothetical protein